MTAIVTTSRETASPSHQPWRMGSDADIVAVLSAATNARTIERKKAALVLANAMRRAGPVHEAIEMIAAEAGRRYGDVVASEVRAIASELHLA